MLCEIIGRVDPDPDYLPRTTSFGLAVAQYYVQFALNNKCPQYFFAIAVTVGLNLLTLYLSENSSAAKSILTYVRYSKSCTLGLSCLFDD